MPSTPLDTVVNSVLVKSRKKLIMASVKSNALQAWAFATRRVEWEDGGKDITNPLTIGRNPNVTSYEYYDTLPMAQTNEFTTVSYNWSRVAGSMVISDQEQDENRGSAAIFKLIRAKADVLEESIREKFSEYLYGSGAGVDPNGLAALIPDDPTAGTVGGIDRAAEVQWRTSAYDFTSSGTTGDPGLVDQTNVAEVMDDVMLDLKMKADKPDLILCGRNLYRIYRAAVRDQMVFALNSTENGKRMADLGFEGVAFNGISMVYDEDCPINKMYFINSKYLRLHIFRHVNMKLKTLVAPWDVDAIGRRVVWQGQWCMWKCFRTHGVVINNPTP